MIDSKGIFIVSSMRSGSTLLNYLLSTKTDVSSLPEIPFTKAERVILDATEPIVIIKSPGWYSNMKSYPQIPNTIRKKVIILIRNPYDTIISLHKMNLATNLAYALRMNEEILLKYWIQIYKNIIDYIDREKTVEKFIVKYENLINDPITTTNKIFNFIETINKNGVDSYNKPDTFKWGWGVKGGGDGGDIIKKLKVISRVNMFNNLKLLKLIKNDSDTKKILRYFNYDHNMFT